MHMAEPSLTTHSESSDYNQTEDQSSQYNLPQRMRDYRSDSQSNTGNTSLKKPRYHL
jgi:hypothetical protein